MNYEEGLQKVQEANEQLVAANRAVAQVIREVYIYQWNWYLSIAMVFIPWVLWAIFRKKDSSARLLVGGLFIMIFSAVLDTIGIENGLWAFPVKAIPSPTLSFSFRLSVLPVLAMFMMQIKPAVNPFIKAILFSGTSAFIGLPLLSMIDLYKKINWHLSYSFMILIVVYLVAHWLTHRNSFHSLGSTYQGKEMEVDLNFLRRREKIR